MSGPSRDIPIRPRYGIAGGDRDTEQAVASNDNTDKGRKASTSNAEEVSSSYKEIPFLAQYVDAAPGVTDVTPTAEKPLEYDNNSEDEADDNDDDSGGDDNSKSSSCDASKTPQRPGSLLCDGIPYELEHSDGNGSGMRHFVAEDLEERLRIASPQSKSDQFAYVVSSNPSHQSTPSVSTSGEMTRHFLQMPQLPQIDANVLSDIEIEAQYLAASVDNLTENLCNLLHSISSITADNVELHKNAVNKLTDSMDANIKCMYTIMAKAEEISNSMQPTERLGVRIREIRRLVDVLDSTM